MLSFLKYYFRYFSHKLFLLEKLPLFIFCSKILVLYNYNIFKSLNNKKYIHVYVFKFCTLITQIFIFYLLFVASFDIYSVELCDICFIMNTVDLIFGNPKKLTLVVLVSTGKLNPFLLKISQILPIWAYYSHPLGYQHNTEMSYLTCSSMPQF